jgi:mRNA-degrading endonuclease RelE of RelBE toxin-antitoxin system
MVKKNAIQSIHVVITIELSRLPADLRSLILKEIKIGEDVTETEHTRDLTTTTGSITEPEVKNDLNVITLNNENNISLIKQKLKDTLIKNKIRDYVVMVDLEDQNSIIILKKEHAKTLGVYHCPHCGMEFENEIQLSVHQRIHYLV